MRAFVILLLLLLVTGCSYLEGLVEGNEELVEQALYHSARFGTEQFLEKNPGYTSLVVTTADVTILLLENGNVQYSEVVDSVEGLPDEYKLILRGVLRIVEQRVDDPRERLSDEVKGYLTAVFRGMRDGATSQAGSGQDTAGVDKIPKRC